MIRFVQACGSRFRSRPNTDGARRIRTSFRVYDSNRRGYVQCAVRSCFTADNEVVAAAEALREKQGVLAQSFLSLGRTLVALKFSKSPRDYEDILVGVRDSQKAAVKTLLGGDASAERVSQMFQFLWDKTNGVIQRKSAVTLAC